MYTMVSTAGLSHEEWLRLRKTGIGGSDAGAICGLNPYSSPMKVYLDKTEEDITDFDNESMRQGRDLEDYVARRFMEETGLKVRRSNMMYRSKENPFMLADGRNDQIVKRRFKILRLGTNFHFARKNFFNFLNISL